MDFIKALILGIVEGFTEFLPVSSTGHLILVNEFVKLEPEAFANQFSVMIQLGAILAVVVLYFHRLNPFPFSKERNPRLPENYNQMNPQSKLYYSFKYYDQTTMQLWLRVIVGIIPSMVFGLLLDDFIDAHLFNPTVVATMLLVWGIGIIVIESVFTKKAPKYTEVAKMPYKIALFIGLFQCLAMIPGTSRSAATILGALILGASRIAAAEFSFFLAIPTMFGATLLKVVKNGVGFTTHQWLVVLFGAIVSFVVALAVIRLFLSYIQRKDFKPFGYYRILLAVLVFAFMVF